MLAVLTAVSVLATVVSALVRLAVPVWTSAPVKSITCHSTTASIASVFTMVSCRFVLLVSVA